MTSTDIDALEEILWKEIGTRQDYEQEFGNKPLGEFVREIVGLDMNAAKEAFSAYLSDTNLDSRQIYFVNQIVEYIVHNGMLKDFSVLQESPFTDRGTVSGDIPGYECVDGNKEGYRERECECSGVGDLSLLEVLLRKCTIINS